MIFNRVERVAFVSPRPGRSGSQSMGHGGGPATLPANKGKSCYRLAAGAASARHPCLVRAGSPERDTK